MKAAVATAYRQPLVLTEVPEPEIGVLEVLIRVKACGVCHSDVHIVDGDFTWGSRLPVIPGHEVAGIVEGLGAEVHHLKVGDRVGLPWLQATCGHCRFCIQGEDVLCTAQKATGLNVDGGFAELVCAPAHSTTVIPDALDLVEAAPLFCAGVTVFTPFQYAGYRTGNRVAVLGIGGLGHLAVQFARALGAEVIAVSRGQEKLQLARYLGAHHGIDFSKDNLAPALQALGGADLILAPTLDTDSMTAAIDGLAADGTLVVLAGGRKPVQFTGGQLIGGRKRIMGSVAGSRKDMRATLEFAARHAIRPQIEIHPLEAANEALDRVRENKPRFRAVLLPNQN
jgi:D-arabinose 1-dehydrogenase-like Zn-dependent alcohol dehydrogenase